MDLECTVHAGNVAYNGGSGKGKVERFMTSERVFAVISQRVRLCRMW
jgi:hypothetical protein